MAEGELNAADMRGETVIKSQKKKEEKKKRKERKERRGREIEDTLRRLWERSKGRMSRRLWDISGIATIRVRCVWRGGRSLS
jgi:hypothetical protein